MLHHDIARSFVLDFNRFSDLAALLTTDIPKRYTSSFPPVDVYQLDNNWIIRLAVAGYTKDDLSISVEDDQLIVKSIKLDSEAHQLNPAAKVIFNGISKRAFERRWQLNQGMEVTEVVLHDGMLTIGVTQHVPSVTTKTIPIQSEPTATFSNKIAGMLK